MNNHEMMALDEKHNAEFEELVKYCMTSGAINLDLYEEYDVREDFEMLMVRVFLQVLQRYRMSSHIS